MLPQPPIQADDAVDADRLLAAALERCASEPIHLAAAVQPHGALLACDGAGTVRMASANLAQVTGDDAATVLGRSLPEVLGAAACDEIERHLHRDIGNPSIPFAIATAGGRALSALVHASDGLRVVELRPAADAAHLNFASMYLPLREALWHFDRDDDVVAYCRFIVGEIRRLTGFDRVLAYCFDDHWDGEVIAESRNEALPSLLGNHFPASDIPPQARLLYQKNLVRVMEDTEAEPAALLPARNPLNGRPLDLSHSALRAMAPVHVSYMRNMGVRASITLSLKQGGRLWGLIACHSASPRVVPFEQRDLLGFVGKTISLKLASLEHLASKRYQSRARQVLLSVTHAVRDAGDLGEGLRRVQGDYLGLADACGCVVAFDGHVVTIGQVPPPVFLDTLTAWLKSHLSDDGILHTEQLASLLPAAAEHAGIASGLLAIALDSELRSYICWFRPQELREIHWAGNPHKQLVHDDSGPRIEPRTSFARWIETARNRARPWQHAEVDAVKLLSLAVLQGVVPHVLRAREAADAANRAKSDFLATVSHEIRTPMNAVMGLTYLCLQTELDTRQHDYLTKVYGSARNLLQLLNDILDFSKIEAGKLALEQIGFHIDDVLERLCTVVSVKAQEKGLEFTLHTAMDVPPALIGDPTRLEQILINLTGNAVKFTPAGGVGVDTEVVHRDGERVRLQFTIRDSGIGMSADQLTRIFQPFEQGDRSITRRYGGTGLGLSISRRLVDMMGGEIDVDSAPGKGTTFRIRLPFRIPADLPAERPQLTSLHGLRVLVLESGGAGREVLLAYLHAFRFRVAEAGSVDEACTVLAGAAAAGTPYDLIFADLRAAGCTAGELAARLGAACTEGSAARLVVLANIADGDPGGIPAGVDAILLKPYTQSRLFNTVARLFGIQALIGSAAPRIDDDTVRSHLRGKRVLLVEDDELNQEVAVHLLAAIGLEVDLACNGQQALERLQQQRYDAVLMDVHMPVLDGYGATRAIRAQPALRTLPVIAMTANAMLQDRERCLHAGMSDHIPKPIDPDNLTRCMLRWLAPDLPGGSVHSPVQAQPAEPLPHLAGIDVERGIWQTGGTVHQYLTLLGRFRGNYQQFIAALCDELASHRHDDAIRRVHSLKGLAGSLGAVALQEKAAALEEALRAGARDLALDALIGAVDSELQAFLGEIARTVTAPPPEAAVAAGGPSRTATRAELLALLDAARSCLEEYDSRVDEVVARLQPLVAGQAAWAGHCQALEKCVRSYDYEAALRHLADWMAELVQDDADAKGP